MSDELNIPVMFKGEELILPCRVLNYSNSYKLEVTIDDVIIQFEPDEERNWRAVLSWEDLQANKKVSKELVEAIAETLTENL